MTNDTSPSQTPSAIPNESTEGTLLATVESPTEVVPENGPAAILANRQEKAFRGVEGSQAAELEQSIVDDVAVTKPKSAVTIDPNSLALQADRALQKRRARSASNYIATARALNFQSGLEKRRAATEASQKDTRKALGDLDLPLAA